MAMRDATELVLGGLIMIYAAGSGPARAQDPVTTSPSAVQECLCAERTVAMLGDRVRAERRRYNQMQANAQNMSRQVEDARGRVNTSDRSDIDAFSALLTRRDAAAEASRAENQRYAAMVGRYNNAVGYNNSACTGRLFDQEEVESIKATLVCPRP
jgi:hypothetical protein